MTFIDDLFGMVIGLLNVKNVWRLFDMDAVTGRIIIDGELYEASGTYKYGYASFDALGKAFIQKNIVKEKGVSVLYVDESTITYDPVVLHKMLKANVITSAQPSLWSILLILGVSIFIGGIFGFVLTVVGWKVVLAFIAICMIFVIMARGFRYVR